MKKLLFSLAALVSACNIAVSPIGKITEKRIVPLEGEYGCKKVDSQFFNTDGKVTYTNGLGETILCRQEDKYVFVLDKTEPVFVTKNIYLKYSVGEGFSCKKEGCLGQ